MQGPRTLAATEEGTAPLHELAGLGGMGRAVAQDGSAAGSASGSPLSFKPSIPWTRAWSTSDSREVDEFHPTMAWETTDGWNPMASNLSLCSLAAPQSSSIPHAASGISEASTSEGQEDRGRICSPQSKVRVRRKAALATNYTDNRVPESVETKACAGPDVFSTSQ